MQQFLGVVRKATLPAIWSQGVKLARANAVTRVAAGKGELTLRVRAAGLAIAPTVTLYLDEEEWSCDCAGKVDPCAHVAAATIVSAQGDAPAEEPGAKAAEPTARLTYRLVKTQRLLTLGRFIIHSDGREERLGGTLASELTRRRGTTDLNPSHDDLRIDRILGSPAREVIPLGRIGEVFDALADAEVTFNGQPAKLSDEPVLPRAVVDDAPGGGFLLRIERDPTISEVITMGVVRCGDTLHPLGETETTGELLEHLPLSRTFTRAHETDLVTKVLPELEKKLTVIVNTKKLPRSRKEARPRIAMDLSHQGHTLSILPTLVYGDPPIARIDGDVVVVLGKSVPVRRRDEERLVLQ
ncbi:MAG: SWIM zinc finger family protein, partial [Polyangiaceae bacterium]